MKSFFPNSDSFNPILVRELRQMVRNQLIVFSINLYLAVMISFFGFMMIEFFESSSETFGRDIFYGLIAITTISTLLAVVLYSGWKVAVDRINEDLLFFTALTPSQNIRGRLVCGFVISLLFFSMSAPFIVTTYLFRGVDLWMYAVFILPQFLLIQVVNLIAAAILSAARSYFQLVFYALLFFVTAVGVSGFGIYLFVEIYETIGKIINGYYHHSLIGIGASPWSPILKWTPLVYYVLVAIISLIFVAVTSYLFGRCNLSPYSDNRMYPIRRWLSWVIAGTLLVWFLYSWLEQYDLILSTSSYRGTNRYLLLNWWFFSVVGIFSAILVIAVCERETWEGRLRRAIPKAIWRRVLVFPLYTGSVNGLLWVFIGTFLLTIFIGIFTSNYTDSQTLGGINIIFQTLIFLMLIFDYSMTAFFLWKILLHYWIPREMIWMITVGLLAVVSFGTFFATFLIRDVTDGGFENDILFSPNPFLVFMSSAVGDFQIFCGFLWFVLIMPCTYPWLRGRFLDFTPEEPKENEPQQPAIL